MLNTTARLETLAKQLGAETLISRDLLTQTALPNGVAAKDLGRHSIKGFAEPVAISGLAVG